MQAMATAANHRIYDPNVYQLDSERSASLQRKEPPCKYPPELGSRYKTGAWRVPVPNREGAALLAGLATKAIL